MFFRKFQNHIVFVDRISFKKLIIMMICIRCVYSQKKCRFFLLFKKCTKCIRIDKRCNSTISMINFFDIDKVLEKLKREKSKIETTWKVVIELVRIKFVKFKRFRQQKIFFKNREQKMFNKDLNDVKKLKRFEFLKTLNQIKIVLIVFFEWLF